MRAPRESCGCTGPAVARLFLVCCLGVLVPLPQSVQLAPDASSSAKVGGDRALPGRGAVAEGIYPDAGGALLMLADVGLSGRPSVPISSLLVQLPNGTTASVRNIFKHVPEELLFHILETPLEAGEGTMPLGLRRSMLNIRPSTLFMPTLLGFSILVLICVSLAGGLHDQASQRTPTSAGASELAHWSLLGLATLQSYRFYTGFLSATWMPYLLAMEGQELARDQQSFFMGCAKLIYGMSILFNPIFGLLSDHVVTVSHWTGRRSFIILGVCMSGLGIYGCMIASDMKVAGWFFVGTILWMVGEALADVTTETLVPEMLPRAQFQKASSIRSILFLLGGFSGYVMIVIFRHETWSWLYKGYLGVMLVCALLTLVSINHSERTSKQPCDGDIAVASFKELLHQAYVAPTLVEGGFPRACLCIFVYSFGSAPMFFLLLMIRDLGGVSEPGRLQMHFGLVSIVFFLSAALASVVLGAKGSPEGWMENEAAGVLRDADEAMLAEPDGARCVAEAAAPLSRTAIPPVEARSGGFAPRWWMMIYAVVAVGAANMLAPLIWTFPTVRVRIAAFYFYSVAFGLAFGCAMSKFQECTWSLLAPGIDVANAMGFATMCKLAGVGFGNFAAGMLLNHYSTGGSEIDFIGYLTMCSFSSIVLFLSAFGVYGVAQQASAWHAPRGK